MCWYETGFKLSVITEKVALRAITQIKYEISSASMVLFQSVTQDKGNSPKEIKTTNIFQSVKNGSNLTKSLDSSCISEQNIMESKSAMKLLKKSPEVQKEINNVFTKLNDIKHQVRIYIDNLCHIGFYSIFDAPD